MKNQALFSSKDKSKKLKCRLLQFLFGALRVKTLSGPRTSRFCVSEADLNILCRFSGSNSIIVDP